MMEHGNLTKKKWDKNMWENGGLTEKTWKHHGRLVILTREQMKI